MSNSIDIKPTPFTVLCDIYQNSLSQNEGWQTVELWRQCEYLKHHKIKTENGRNFVVNNLVNEKKLSVVMEHKENIRLVLLWYCTDIESLNNKPLSRWIARDFTLSFFHYLINHVVDTNMQKRLQNDRKTWKFMKLLQKYFEDCNYNSTRFQTNDQCGTELTKIVCSINKLKIGNFVNIKKQLNLWGIYIQKEQVTKPTDIEQKMRIKNVADEFKNSNNMTVEKKHNHSDVTESERQIFPSQKYNKIVVDQLVAMGFGSRDNVIEASTKTVNYNDINEVMDQINEMTKTSNQHLVMHEIIISDSKPVAETLA
eukprot:536364_1